VTKSQRFLLPNVRDIDHVRNLTDDREQILFIPGLEQVLELEAHIKMIFDRGFSAPRHDNDVLNARMQRFFDAVLNNRLIDKRKHFLGLRLRGRKKSGPKTRGWKDCFANFRCRHRSYLAHSGGICATPESADEYFPALRDADSIRD